MEDLMVDAFIVSFGILALCIFSMTNSPDKSIFSKTVQYAEIKSFKKKR